LISKSAVSKSVYRWFVSATGWRRRKEEEEEGKAMNEVDAERDQKGRRRVSLLNVGKGDDNFVLLERRAFSF
jgi:microcompartment protein CcmK/EutM